MNNVVTSITLYVLTITSAETPEIRTFSDIDEASAGLRSALAEGHTVAMTKLDIPVGTGQTLPEQPKTVKAKTTKSSKTTKKATTPAKSDMSDADTTKYLLIVKIKESGKEIARKVITGKAKADKYAATCRSNKVAKTVQITRYEG